MATAPKLDLVEQSATTDIVAIVAQTPVVVLIDKEKRTNLYAHIEREIEAFVPDLTTDKGRKAIAALAFKVTRTKTAIDAAGKQLNEEARAKINLVDEARRDARNTLDILAERARKPLTEWEQAEEARVTECRKFIDGFKHDAMVSLEDTADNIRKRGAAVWSIALDPDRFGDMLAEAQAAKDTAVATLKEALARLVREEADRAELEKLRAAQAEREAREAEEAAARELAEREAEAARIAEEQRVATEQAEAQRIEDARREAADAAQREADARHAAELAAERAKLAAVERDAQAERERVAELDRQRLAKEAAEQREAEQAAADQARREANQRHVSSVMRAAKEAIMACGVDEPIAKAIVIAIKGGMIPAVTIAF